MHEDIQKFRDLLLTDAAFQQKLKAAIETYTGEQTEEAVFYNVLTPLAQEYGISATYEDFKSYIEKMTADSEGISDEELAQIAGGAKGYGLVGCMVIGAGLGGAGGGGKGGACLMIGAGWQGVSCSGNGFTDDIDIGSLIKG